MSTQRSRKMQMALNLGTSATSFLVSSGVAFFLTPYIVDKLGTAAYGFWGLSNNIIGYTALLTVALNSMSRRFIAIKFHEGDLDSANRYLSSTYFANIAFATFIVLVLGIVTVFLEYMIKIPANLMLDVKFLFTLMFVNSAFNLVTGIYGIGTFIANRLEISNLRDMISVIMRGILLVVLYGFFPAHLWYFGMAALICSTYSILYNYHYFRVLTPSLKIRLSHFSLHSVWEMMTAGAWNLISSLSGVINAGFQLLLANLFVSALAMGQLSIASTLPLMILSLFATLAGNFSPEYVKYYAQKNMDALKHVLLQGMRLLGVFTAIPVVIIAAYGDIFYQCWLPGENSSILYWLTIVTLVGMVFALPCENLWYIFTLTKQVKRSSLNLLWNATLSFVIILAGMFIFKDDTLKLFWIVIVRQTLGTFRCLTFLPLYGARVLNFPRYTFYKPILRMLISVIILLAISLLFRWIFITTPAWWPLIFASLFTAAIGTALGCFITLLPSDRQVLTSLLRSKLHI